MVVLKGCPKLREMDVFQAGMGTEAGGALVQALREGAWPQLTLVDIAGNHGLFSVSEEVGRCLAEVIEGRKFPHLEDLFLYESGMSSEVVARVLGAQWRGVHAQG